ncbi:MAG: ABC-F family ATP-binding cassette domain-containing protein, partial [Treponema sp.]|nr:ABC-F family ATP-binding cassette domain-containing protein [Treponema sp.]
QSGVTHHGCTLLQEADKAFQYGYDMQNKIDQLGAQLESNPSNMQQLAEMQAELIQKLNDSGWHRRQSLAESVLLGLGFLRSDFDRNTEEFSGGWQMRIALAKALMQNPDILLLDEPTNYLDLEARSWLEEFLQNYKGGFLLVSHDRYFLDVTINEVYELFNGELKRYPGNYTHYEKVRETELKTLMAAYEQQQQEIQKLEDFITRFGYKATKAAQAQEYQKKLDKMVRIEIPESLKKIHFTFPPAPHAGRLVLRMNGITKSYDGHTNVLNNLDLTLENGQRLVVAGRNGAGKSTLLRIIAEQDSAFTGEIIPGSGVKIGYFSQDNAETIKGSCTILEYLENVAPLDLIPKLRDMLGAFLFRGDDVFKSLDVLSGGEKSRIALLQLLLSPVNLLVLDEPTNHLDLHSKDVLLQALRDFGGTIVFVSHDRGFIEQLATHVLHLEPGKSMYYPGDYKYYLEQTEKGGGSYASLPSFVSDSKASENKTSLPLETKSKDNNLSWEEQKRIEAERRKKEKALSNLEQQIAALEEKKSALESKLADPQIYSNGEKAKSVQHEIESVTTQIETLSEQWLALSE